MDKALLVFKQAQKIRKKQDSIISVVTKNIQRIEDLETLEALEKSLKIKGDK
ncbi:hypothetical protein [Priestia megaterium]|uniref:hypothetical protein n=1 Tax=Priestia megaterium TaxID=1404 RepID=UPI0028779C58|nr:hypothetical protein [Priestia megaterium]MBX4161661.1 hypothetical protein [Priestia megaterium]